MKSYSASSQLELVTPDAPRASVPEAAASGFWLRLSKLVRFNGFWSNLFERMIGPSEPRIYRRRDRHGDLYYQVYDPRIEHPFRLNSEQEVRVWLDERYYYQVYDPRIEHPFRLNSKQEVRVWLDERYYYR